MKTSFATCREGVLRHERAGLRVCDAGLCADLFAHVLLEHELVVGEIVLDELREKLRTKLKLPRKTIDEIEALLREGIVVETPSKHLSLKIGDPDDEWVVASAMASGADVLVTGDAAVLRSRGAHRCESCPHGGCGISCAVPNPNDDRAGHFRQPPESALVPGWLYWRHARGRDGHDHLSGVWAHVPRDDAHHLLPGTSMNVWAVT